MSTAEKITVKLTADVKDYAKKMRSAKAANDDLANSSGNLSSKAAMVATRLAAVASVAAIGVGAVAALGVGIGAMVNKSADAVREFENLRRATKLTGNEFKAATIATTAFGVSAEQFSDISKDISDRLGEFAKVGTGAFQDFADVVGMSTSEAQELARQMQDMSSTQVIGQLVMMMENAGATTNEMTFVLESMGNELSRLIPLFEDGSAKLEEMTKRFEGILEPIALTTEETAALAEAGIAFDLLSQSMDGAGKKISAQFAPAMTDIVNFIAEKVPAATAAVTDLLNTLGIGDEINIAPTAAKQEEDTGAGRASIPDQMSPEEQAERLAEIYDLHLNNNQKILESDIAYYDASIEALRQANEEKVISEEEYNEELRRLTKERAREYEREAREEDKRLQAKQNFAKNAIQAGKILNNSMFEDNKAVSAGLIVADTAVAIMKSLSINPYDYGNVAVIAATGIAQLAAALGASKGGGSSPSAPGGGGSTGTQINNQQDFQRETFDLDLQSTVQGESRSRNKVSIDLEGSDDFLDALADRMAERRRAT